MASTFNTPLLARLRASTRLAAMVLLLFLLKIGVVVACSSHDLVDSGMSGAAGEATALAFDADLGAGDGGNTSDPLQENGCVDCHCHHAATLLPELRPIPWNLAAAEPVGLIVCARSAVPRQELRPPIA